MYFFLSYVILFPFADFLNFISRIVHVNIYDSHNDLVAVFEIYISCMIISLITVAILLSKVNDKRMHN